MMIHAQARFLYRPGVVSDFDIEMACGLKASEAEGICDEVKTPSLEGAMKDPNFCPRCKEITLNAA